MPYRVCVTGFLVAIALTCPDSTTDESRGPQKTMHRAASDHLDNVWRIGDRILSGSQPAGDGAFAELRRLGVRTIISVDAAVPDVRRARRFGIRYVHLPVGYDGIDARQAARLAKAIRELPGPIYIHSPHGRHRGPAAAAVACIGAGMITPSQGLEVLRKAGTSPHYQGLFDSVQKARALSREELDSVPHDFPEVARVPDVPRAMAELDVTFERMKEVAANGWNTPPAHPDIKPAHEALLLRERFQELLRLETVRNWSNKPRTMVEESWKLARQLENRLRTPNSQRDVNALNALLEQIGNRCVACHRAYRDRPSQKLSDE